MSRVAAIIFRAVIFSTIGYAMTQTPLHAQRKFAEENLTRPLLLSIDGKDAGSGFYLNVETGTWLITAKHVLLDQKGEFFGSSLQALGYNANDTVGTILEFDLPKLLSSGALRVHRSADVAAIEVATATEPPMQRRTLWPVPGVSIKQLAEAGITGPVLYAIYDEVWVGNDVLLAGYPSRIGIATHPQIDFKQPLLRAGIVAAKNREKKTIVVDSSVFPGNSGGPVIQISGGNPFRVDLRVIGVVSEFVPFDNSFWMNQVTGGSGTFLNSGYSIVTPMDPVLDLIAGEHPR